MLVAAISISKSIRQAYHDALASDAPLAAGEIASALRRNTGGISRELKLKLWLAADRRENRAWHGDKYRRANSRPILRLEPAIPISWR